MVEWVCLNVDDIKRDQEAQEAILKGEIPDLTQALLPMVIAFKRTGAPASKAIFTAGTTAAAKNLPVSVFVMKVGTKFVKDDKYSYFVPTAEVARMSTRDELSVAKGWFDNLFKQRADLKVDDSDEIKAEMDETPKTVKTAASNNYQEPPPPHQDEQATQLDDIPF